MSRTTRFSFALVLTGGSLLFAQPGRSRAPEPLIPNAAPVRSCESLASIQLANTTIESAAAAAGAGNAAPWCRVVAVVTHPPAGDRIRIFLGLPNENWNGRFQGRGGGGFSGGRENSILGPVAEGYAAGSTDTGHEGGGGSFALDKNGHLNWTLIRDNAHVGIHEMTRVGKALTAAYYGTAPRRSYFNGCSTGGRQGLMEAQRYPDDYDGILSGAPAINWPQLHVAQLWGQWSMLAAGNFIPKCKLEAVRAAAIAACDTIDQVKDGVIEDPRRCRFDPHTLVGKTLDGCAALTDEDAAVIWDIQQGPRRQDGSFLWYGFPPGADLSRMNATGGDPLTGRPFRITLDYFRYFLAQDPDWDWTTITRGGLEQFWDQSVEQYGAVLGTNQADLSAFRDAGGKAIVWHGWADPLIFAQGTIDYYTHVREAMSGGAKASEFIRLFMAPGAVHCRSGDGPAPDAPFDALLRWVEECHPPDSLQAVLRDESRRPVRSRLLCPFPLVARYKGSGSTDEADNFECAEDF